MRRLPSTARFAAAAGALALVACGPGDLDLGGSSPSRGALIPSGAKADVVVFQGNFQSNRSARTDPGGFEFIIGAPLAAGLAEGGGQLYMIDQANSRILGYGLSSVTAGSDADDVMLQADEYDTSHRQQPAELQRTPRAVAVDSTGALYVYMPAAGGFPDDIYVFNDPVSNDVRPDLKLTNVPVGVRSMRVLPTGPGSVERLVVTDGTNLLFYPIGRPEPIVSLAFGAASGSPCSPGQISDVAEIAGTLLIACANALYRCDEIPTGSQPLKPNYQAPLATCGAVFAFRLDVNPDTPTRYDPPHLPPNTGPGPLPAYAFPGAGVTSIQVAADGLAVSQHTANRIVRFGGVEAHLTALFANDDADTCDVPGLNPAGAACSFLHGAIAPDDVRDLIHGQNFVTQTACNRGNATEPDEQTLCTPTSVVFDSNDHLWAADTANHRIVKYEGTASPSAVMVLGQKNYAQQLANRLEGEAVRSIDDIAINPNDGMTYVVDRVGNRVLAFADAADLHNNKAPVRVYGQVDEISYEPNAFSSSPTDPRPVEAKDLSGPTHVAIDPSGGDLYVSDANNRRIVIYSTTTVDTIADGVIGAANLETIGAAGFTFGPMVIFGRRLYVATTSAGTPNRIFVYDLPSTCCRSPDPLGIPDRVIGQHQVAQLQLSANDVNRGAGIGFPRPDGLYNITGLAFDPAGVLWVADAGNNRVVWFNEPADADIVAAENADGVVGQRDMASLDTLSPQGVLGGQFGFGGSISDIAVTTGGTLWVVDSNRNRVLGFADPKNIAIGDSAPRATAVLGQSDFVGTSGNAGGIGARSMSNPRAAAVDDSGRVLLVADTGNNRMLRFYDNAPPTLKGTGTFEVAEGELREVQLEVTDPDGDQLGPLRMVDPVPADVTLSGTTVTFQPRPATAGQLVRVYLEVSDLGPRPETTSGSVIFRIIEPLAAETEATAPIPEPFEGCLCGSTPVSWLLLLVLLPYLTRRRQRQRRRR